MAEVLLLTLTYVATAVIALATDLAVVAKIAIICVAGAVTLGYNLVQVRRPFARSRAEQCGRLIGLVLSSLATAYSAEIHNAAAIRFNVRIPRWHLDGLRPRRFLCMEHYHGIYPEDEVLTRFRIGLGSCGRAFKSRNVDVYDRVTNHEALAGMTVIQRRVTQHVASILAVPIFASGMFRRSAPIGILSLDSEASASEVHFDEQRAQALARQYAEYISHVLS